MKRLSSFGFVPQCTSDSCRRKEKYSSSGGRDKQYDSIQPELHATPERADQPVSLQFFSNLIHYTLLRLPSHIHAHCIELPTAQALLRLNVKLRARTRTSYAHAQFYQKPPSLGSGYAPDNCGIIAIYH